MSVNETPDPSHCVGHIHRNSLSPGSCYAVQILGSDTLEADCLPIPDPQAITPSPKTPDPLCEKPRRARESSFMVPGKLTVHTKIVVLHGGDLGRPQVDLSLVRPRVLPAQIADVQVVGGLQEAHSALIARVGHHDGSRMSLFPWHHSGKAYVGGPDDVLNLFIQWYFRGRLMDS